MRRKAMSEGREMNERCLAKIICDSQPPEGARLTTMEVVVPRIVLAEFNTHRKFSRNSASSRAIPIEKMLKRVIDDPYIPETWGKNQKGMQADEALEKYESGMAEERWLWARDHAVDRVRDLLKLGVHKQITNRLLEPFMWHTIIVTATEWSNFFHLRCHPDAHPAIRNTAVAMREVYWDSIPNGLDWGEWHLPFIHKTDSGLSVADKVKLSSARCARVSYLTHDGVRDPDKDLELHDRLLAGGHMSPFEHPAQANNKRHTKPMTSNFAKPWIQYRKTIPYEDDVHANPERT